MIYKVMNGFYKVGKDVELVNSEIVKNGELIAFSYEGNTDVDQWSPEENRITEYPNGAIIYVKNGDFSPERPDGYPDLTNIKNYTSIISAGEIADIARKMDEERLLRFSHAIHSQDKFGNTPLHLVMFDTNKVSSYSNTCNYYKHTGTISDVDNGIDMLIKHGADVNARNFKGNTPLMFAASFDDIDYANKLIKNGADINIANLDGDTAFDFARRHRNSSSSHVDGAVEKLLLSIKIADESREKIESMESPVKQIPRLNF